MGVESTSFPSTPLLKYPFYCICVCSRLVHCTVHPCVMLIPGEYRHVSLRKTSPHRLWLHDLSFAAGVQTEQGSLRAHTHRVANAGKHQTAVRACPCLCA